MRIGWKNWRNVREPSAESNGKWGNVREPCTEGKSKKVIVNRNSTTFSRKGCGEVRVVRFIIVAEKDTMMPRKLIEWPRFGEVKCRKISRRRDLMKTIRDPTRKEEDRDSR